MKQHFKKLAGKKTGIGQRLNQLLTSLSTPAMEVWGLENKITKSVREYFKKIAVEENVTTDQLCVMIRYNGRVLKMWLWISDTTLRPLATSELLNFFGFPTLHADATEAQVKAFLYILSEKYRMAVDQVRLTISVPDQKAMVRLYRDTDFKCEIPMRDMLNHFLP